MLACLPVCLFACLPAPACLLEFTGCLPSCLLDFAEFEVEGHTTTRNANIASSLELDTDTVKGNTSTARRLQSSRASLGNARQLVADPERSIKLYELAVYYASTNGENVLTPESLIKVQNHRRVCCSCEAVCCCF